MIAVATVALILCLAVLARATGTAIVLLLTMAWTRYRAANRFGANYS